jgi:Phage integrase family
VPDLPAVLANSERVARYAHDKKDVAGHLRRQGLDLIENLGLVRFTGPHSVAAGDGGAWSADRVILAVGGHAARLPIPGAGLGLTCEDIPAVGERTDGPVFLAADGRRLDRHGAGRIVRKTARRAGIGKAVKPHTLRHAFITAALDAGVPLRDVQEVASHADPRTTMRYDRARGSLDRHATYIVAAYVAGAAR